MKKDVPGSLVGLNNSNGSEQNHKVLYEKKPDSVEEANIIEKQNPANSNKVKQTPSIQEGDKADEKIVAKSNSVEPHKLSEEEYKGLFSRLVKHLESGDVNSNRSFLKQIIENDLIDLMKDFSQNKRQGKPSFIHEKDLDLEIKEKIKQLHNMENSWRKLEHEVFEKNILIKEKEAEIASEVSKLQEMVYLFDKIKDLPEEKWFKLENGASLKSLKDLKQALETMKNSTFYHHVNAYKNDFARWIKDVFLEDKLASDFAKAKNKDDALNILTAFLNN